MAEESTFFDERLPEEQTEEQAEEETESMEDRVELGDYAFPVDENGKAKVDFVDLIEQPAWKTILLELVKTNKMDPWDIEVCQLADLYLNKINSLSGTDLRLPANAVLVCAILLKFKSRVLVFSDWEKDELAEKKEISEEEKKFFDGALLELKSARRLKEGKISLDDLVDVIEIMMEKSKKKSSKSLLEEAEKPEFKIPLLDENIEEKIEKTWGQLQQFKDSQGLVLFSNMVKGKPVIEIVDTFIPILFLINKQKVNAWQDEFFGELYINVIAEKLD